MTVRRMITLLAALLMSGSLVAVIELPAMGASTLWLVLVVCVSCVTAAWVGWNASRPG